MINRRAVSLRHMRFLYCGAIVIDYMMLRLSLKPMIEHKDNACLMRSERCSTFSRFLGIKLPSWLPLI